MRAVRPMTSETCQPTQPGRSTLSAIRDCRAAEPMPTTVGVSGFHCSGTSSARRLADSRARLLDHLGLLSAFGEQIERLNAR
jgi:hypothetical protein